MNHHHRIRIILPTDEVIQEFRPAESLLYLIESNVKDIVAYVANYWISHQEPWEYGQPSYSPIHMLMGYLDTDFIGDLLCTRHDPRDVTDIRHILTRIGLEVYLNIMPVLDSLHLSDHTSQQLRCDGWVGDSLIVSTVGKPQYG